MDGLTHIKTHPKEAEELLEEKFISYCENAEESGLTVNVHPGIIKKIASLSGGHPHIIQLLGSNVVESEEDNPDGIIDGNDLMGSLRKICYEDRGTTYQSTYQCHCRGRYGVWVLGPQTFPGPVQRQSYRD